MARVSYSPLITALSGSVKDSTFSKWKGRDYLRARVIPANPNTLLQQAQRARMAAAVNYWQSIHADLAAWWNEYAATYQMSGFNACTARNIKLMAIADANHPILTPPAPKIKAIEAFSAVPNTPAAITISWDTDGWTSDDDGYIAVLHETGNDYYPRILKIETQTMDMGTTDIFNLNPVEDYTVIMAALVDAEDAFTSTVGDKNVAAGT
jgi:hypothetical protein